MSEFRRFLALPLVVLVAFVVAGCGATDNINVAKAGLGTAQYLKEIQPQLTAYSSVVSTMEPAAPASAAKTKRIEDGAAKLRDIKKELEGIEPADDYKDAHKDLIASVDETADALEEMAKTKDTAKYNAVVSGAYSDATTHFAKAMEAATKPVTDAANQAS